LVLSQGFEQSIGRSGRGQWDVIESLEILWELKHTHCPLPLRPMLCSKPWDKTKYWMGAAR